MIRRKSMSFLQSMMDEVEQEQYMEIPLRGSLRRSPAVDDSSMELKDDGSKYDEPPDLPTSPRPLVSNNVFASLSDEDHFEIVRQKISFDLSANQKLNAGAASCDNRLLESSRSSSTVQTPFSAVEYDFSSWNSTSPVTSLRSPNRSTFLSSTPCLETYQENVPRSWSSRAIADEDFISVVGWDTVSATMNTLVEQQYYHRSIDDIDGAANVLNKMHAEVLSGRSSSTTQLITLSDGGSSPRISPRGRKFSQSESALDEMDDDRHIRSDMVRTKKLSESEKQLSGLPRGDAKNEIQYQSLDDILAAISPMQDEFFLKEERWRGETGGIFVNERKRSSAEILPSGLSFLGVEMESEEEEFHEDDENSSTERNNSEGIIEGNTSADPNKIDDEKDFSCSRSLSSADFTSSYDRECSTVDNMGEKRRDSSIDEPSDFAPCLSPPFQDAGRTMSNASSSPSEPDEFAPGTNNYKPESPNTTKGPMMSELALHRRAISNKETSIDGMHHEIRNTASDIVRARSSGGRSSMLSGRCVSQVMTPVPQTTTTSTAHSPIGRNLSSSDPALNELEQNDLPDVQQMDVTELNYEGRPARHPPPVLLPRKQSQLNSWRSPFAVATARGVMNPRVQVPQSAMEGSHASAPPSRDSRERYGTLPDGVLEKDIEADEKSPGDRSRVDKKRESGGSTRAKVLDSLSHAFFSERKRIKSKTSDRSLEGFMQQFGMKNSVHSRRPTAHEGSAYGSLSVEGLPDDLASVLDGESHHGTLRMPSSERSPSAFRSSNGPEEYSFELRSLSLCSDLWDRFGLFDQEIHSAWHEKYSTEGMTSKQLKKQDAIFELIVQERRHCAHLAFLKKGYRQRLVEEHVLNAADADKLIPDVLDAMLAFHLHLLDRLVERQRISKNVDTVADIIAEELGDGGRFTTRAVDAYTSFGAAKESAEAYYTQLLNKGGRFAGFYNKLQADPNYRRYAYKTLLTVIIGRPTKYLLMLDQILKNEDDQKIGEQTKEAAEAARKFAARIDYGLQVCQMSKKWEEIKGQFEPSSKTMLHTGDGSIIPFTMDDLQKDTFENGSRKILCMGDVMAKSMSVYLILFDDILVVLQRKGGRMAFIQHEQAVLPVYSLHIRSTERQNSAFVISSCKPALLQFDFLNRNDRLKWVKVFETAIARAPKQVRMTPRSQNDSKQQARERAMEEERMKRIEDEWLKKLESIFDDRKPDEAALASYFGSRQKWFDHLRRHVGEMPYRSKTEIPDKVRQTVRARFRELRAARVIPLAEMVERCTAAREGDLWAFFDDKHEMAAGPSDDSDSSGSGKSGKQPRRIQTFHGTTTDSREKSSIRRHTTVPKMSGCGSAVSSDGLHRIRTESDSESEDESDNERKETPEEREERIRIKNMYRVPLSLPLRARKATSRLVDDMVQLRLENNLLRNQAALDKMRLAFLERQRSPGYSTIVAPTETMEALRRKEQEIREEEIRVKESEDYSNAQLAQREKELTEQKARLTEQEVDLERKWLAYKEHTSTPSRSSSQKENGAPCEESRRDKRIERTASTCSELSPTLKGLSIKSETRRKK